MNDNLQNNHCAIMVTSLDAYQDTWHPFFTLFFKYWPDCPFIIYLISETLTYTHSKIKMIHVKKDEGWSTNLHIALKYIKENYLIILLDDYFLKKKVDNRRILKLLSIIKDEKAAYLRLFPSPGPDFPYKDYSEVGKISLQAPYRTSLMAAIWDKQILEDLLIDGENAWEMEIKGTERSKKIAKPFLSVRRSKILDRNNNPALHYFLHVIRRGKWQAKAIKWCQKEKIKINTSFRPIQVNHDSFVLLKKLYTVYWKTGKYLKKIITYYLKQWQ